mgnify:FL=1
MTRTESNVWQAVHYERPFTQNSLYGKGNHYTRAKQVKAWRESFAWLALKARMPHMERCSVAVIPHLRDNRAQDTGACFPAVKAAIDGLVDAGVLDDDGPDHVTELRFFRPVLSSDLGDALMVEVTRLA